MSLVILEEPPYEQRRTHLDSLVLRWCAQFLGNHVMPVAKTPCKLGLQSRQRNDTTSGLSQFSVSDVIMSLGALIRV